MSPTYPILHRDYETRSECDLKKCGVHVYAQHPSTRLLCAVWIIETSPREFSKPYIARPAAMDDETYFACPGIFPEIAALINSGCTVAGHNAAFEHAIDVYHTGPKLRWPVPGLDQLDCTMARAAVQALPLDLDRLSRALDLPVQKDKVGHRLMLQMRKPRKANQHENSNIVHWHYDEDKIRRLIDYCITDVRTEIEADHRLRPLQDQEWPVWVLDQIMNMRGVQIDREFVDCAEAMVKRALARADARMIAVTHGAVDKVSQVGRLMDFAKAHGVEFETVEKIRRSGEVYEAERADKEALGDLLVAVVNEDDEGFLRNEDADVYSEGEGALPLVPGKPNLEWRGGDPPSVRAAFELRLEAGKSSLAKLAKFKSQAPDGRARGNLQYHGAAPGRWAGRGIQMQNLVRKGITEPGGWDQAFRDMRELDDETFETVWGSPFDVISRMMRGAVIAAPGHQLYFADFANVEARGCVWAAGQDDMVRLFASGALIYEEMAAEIFGISVEEVVRLHVTKENIIPRFVGKETILGCGYGMGPSAFQRNCKKKGGILLPMEICEKGVYGWRDANPNVVNFWYQLEKAAKRAIEYPGQICPCGPFAYRVKGPWLQCKLPSGRLIWYRRPRLDFTDEKTLPAAQLINIKTKYVGAKHCRITYWGVNSYTKQWAEEVTWGGKLFENCIQGMCADFLRYALINLETACYWPVLSVHDEPISEVEIGFGSVEEYVRIVSEVPSWAAGFPLKAQGGCGTRYTKA